MLLPDLNEVRRRPIHHEASWEDEPPDPEEEGHDPGQRLLLLACPGGRSSLHLPLLVVGRPDHRQGEEVVGDPYGCSMAALKLGNDGIHLPVLVLHLDSPTRLLR